MEELVKQGDSCELVYGCSTNGTDLKVWYSWDENCFPALEAGWSPPVDIAGCNLCFPRLIHEKKTITRKTPLCLNCGSADVIYNQEFDFFKCEDCLVIMVLNL